MNFIYVKSIPDSHEFIIAHDVSTQNKLNFTIYSKISVGPLNAQHTHTHLYIRVHCLNFIKKSDYIYHRLKFNMHTRRGSIEGKKSAQNSCT